MRIEIPRNMNISQLMIYLNSIKHIEARMREIEKMDKNGLNIDQQGELLDEYNELWDKVNKMKHTN